MAVFRVERNSNYTTMSNYHLRDNNLSLKAKGLLSVFLSLPDSWHYSVRGLVAICKEGRDCIVATLQELENAGYLERHQQRQDNGKMGVIEYVIFEKPQSPCTENPDTVKPDTAYPNTEKPDTENPPQIITNRTNTEQINKLNEKDTRHKYGAYQNVLLTDEELAKLKAEFPADWQERLERLSEYIASSGKHYKNHLATLRSWARRDKPKTASYSHSNYTCAEGDSL
ncbi:MAG: helix-turn-helix domain-containing protein [Clostridiales bacterium]|nr:helix-turn-helix domain-containing protein [Clostridiales bacterium]